VSPRIGMAISELVPIYWTAFAANIVTGPVRFRAISEPIGTFRLLFTRLSGIRVFKTLPQKSRSHVGATAPAPSTVPSTGIMSRSGTFTCY
jgi:hypothetical protein